MSQPGRTWPESGETEPPRVGDRAPEIRLQGIGGRAWSLAEQRERHHVVLLFYVLDWTPG